MGGLGPGLPAVQLGVPRLLPDDEPLPLCGASQSHRTEPRKVAWFAYKERHLSEYFFNKINHYRRILKDLAQRHGHVTLRISPHPAAVMCQQNLGGCPRTHKCISTKNILWYLLFNNFVHMPPYGIKK